MIEGMSGQKMTQTREIEQKLIARIPKGWGRYVSCQEGWYPILEDLENKLSYLDPDYKIAQVKEKFGTLRFYFDTDAEPMIKSIMRDCFAAAEFASSYTCEYCGNSLGKLQTETGWAKTSCSQCWAKKMAERNNREQALTELVKFNEENGLYDKDLQ